MEKSKLIIIQYVWRNRLNLTTKLILPLPSPQVTKFTHTHTYCRVRAIPTGTQVFLGFRSFCCNYWLYSGNFTWPHVSHCFLGVGFLSAGGQGLRLFWEALSSQGWALYAFNRTWVTLCVTKATWQCVSQKARMERWVDRCEREEWTGNTSV